MAAGSLLGCGSIYYQHSTHRQFQVSTQGDAGGPRGDKKVFVQPAIVEYLVTQPEAVVKPYYEILLSFDGRMNPNAGFMSQAAWRVGLDLKNELNSEIPNGVERNAAAYARAAGKLVAPGAVRSIYNEGFARIAWGNKIDVAAKDLSMINNGFYITVDAATQIVRLSNTPPDTTVPMKGTNFDVSKVPNALSCKDSAGAAVSLGESLETNPSQCALTDFDAVAAKIERLEAAAE
jgi:hypothetical protein